MLSDVFDVQDLNTPESSIDSDFQRRRGRALDALETLVAGILKGKAGHKFLHSLKGGDTKKCSLPKGIHPFWFPRTAFPTAITTRRCRGWSGDHFFCWRRGQARSNLRSERLPLIPYAAFLRPLQRYCRKGMFYRGRQLRVDWKISRGIQKDHQSVIPSAATML